MLKRNWKNNRLFCHWWNFNWGGGRAPCSPLATPMLQVRKTKKVFANFSARFLAFSNEISTVQKIVLSWSREQGNFRGLVASRPRPRTWPTRSRPRTSKCVLEDSNSVSYFKNFGVRLKRLKSSNFGEPRLGRTPILEPRIFVVLNLFFNIFPFRKFDPSSSHSLKIQSLAATFQGDSRFWYPQILSYFIFFSYLPTLKISCVKREWLKSYNFGSSVLGRPLILVPPTFCKSLSFLCVYLP